MSRQAVYQSEFRARKRSGERPRLKPLVQEVRMLMPRVGTRKLYHLIHGRAAGMGIKIGRDALFDHLRSENMLIKPKKSYTRTTNSKHWMRKHPNLPKGLKPSRPEEVFVSDITYLSSREKTHYLSLVTDAYSRKIMGYELSDDMGAEHVAKALKMAIKNRSTDKPLIHHSDRGLQYCSCVYQDILSQNKIRPSMTDGYDCYQNALAERMNGILKQEFLFETCNTKPELELPIKQAVEIYNTKRPHLSLGLETPNFVHKKNGSD